MDTQINTIFDKHDFDLITKIAKDTGRSRGAVVRRLVSLVHTTEAKRLLGTDEEMTRNYIGIQEKGVGNDKQ